jgi:protein-disulfide isomerase
MRVLLVSLFALAGSLSPVAGQGKFIGVDDDPVLGDAGAKVTIIEFGDYQCPSCRMFWKDVEPRLKKDYVDTGKVKLVFRDFPIVQIHPEAMLAAMAVNCAGEQSKVGSITTRSSASSTLKRATAWSASRSAI